jgi:hypothetical protein
MTVVAETAAVDSSTKNYHAQGWHWPLPQSLRRSVVVYKLDPERRGELIRVEIPYDAVQRLEEVGQRLEIDTQSEGLIELQLTCSAPTAAASRSTGKRTRPGAQAGGSMATSRGLALQVNL